MNGQNSALCIRQAADQQVALVNRALSAGQHENGGNRAEQVFAVRAEKVRIVVFQLNTLRS